MTHGFNFQEADQQIRSIWKLEAGRGKRNMVLGFLGARMKESDRWQANGYADEAAYRDAVGVSTGVWGRYVRIAGCFKYLNQEQFCQMTAENAEQLGALPEELRYDPDWLRDAAKLQAEEFRKLAMIEKAKIAGVEVQDMRVKWGISLFEAQRTVIKNGLADFMLEHAILDEGTALEWLVMEYSRRKTFAKFIQEQLPELRKGLSAEMPVMALGNHIQALSAMLENLKGDQ